MGTALRLHGYSERLAGKVAAMDVCTNTQRWAYSLSNGTRGSPPLQADEHRVALSPQNLERILSMGCLLGKLVRSAFTCCILAHSRGEGSRYQWEAVPVDLWAQSEHHAFRT